MKISKLVVSNAKYTYYQQKNIIYVTDNATKKTTQLLKAKPKTVIWQLFLDNKGTLYYVGYNEHEATYYIYKCIGRRQTVIAKSIDELLRVDKDYIYYVVFDQKSVIKRYAMATGKTEIVNVKTDKYLSDSKISRLKPLLISSGYAINLKTGDTFKALDADTQSAMISKDGKSLMLFSWNLGDTPVELYSLENGEHVSIKLPQEVVDVHTPFTPDDFIFTGQELQLLYENNLYIINASDGQLVMKTAIMDDFVRDPVNFKATGSFCSWAVDSGKWYLLVQKPSKYDMKTGMEEIVEIQPLLYSFDILTHERKLLWSVASYYNNGASASIDIDGGTVWFFTYSNCNNFWMKLPLAGLEKAVVN